MSNVNNLKMKNTDSTNWVIAWICCFMTFVLLGVARLSGLLFVAVMHSYGVTRREASLPFVLCYTVRNIAGPLIGYLGRRFGLRRVCVIGCFLSASGIGFCFFAENVLTITYLWGGVFGLGLGLSTILIPEILRQHFSIDLAKANGIAFGGECLAGFMLPLLFKITLKTYGTQGSFLILSGLVLNSIPAAMLLKKPERKRYCNRTNDFSNITSRQTDNIRSSPTRTSTFYYQIKNSVDLVDDTFKNIKHWKSSVSTPLLALETDINESESDVDEKLSQKELKIQNKETLINSVCNGTEIISRDLSHSEMLLSYSPTIASTANSYNSKSLEHLNKENCFIPSSNRKYQSCEQVSANTNDYKNCIYNETTVSSIILKNNKYIPEDEKQFYEISRTEETPVKITSPSNSFSVFLDITFLLILFTQSLFIYIATTVLTIVVDYSKDIGVAKHEEIYIVMGMSFTDMIGRFMLGFVTDSGFMSEVTFSSLSFAIMGILLFSSVWLKGFVLLMIVMLMFSLLIGGLLIVFPGIVSQHVEEDYVTMALASRLSLYGPLSLTQSYLIGFFRGTLGSYDGIFYTLTFLCFICSVFTVLTPIAAERRRKRNTLTNIS